MTSNSSNNYIHNNKKIGKILYGNCLSPITNSTDSLTIVKQKQKDTDESNNEIVKTNNKRNFFRKFKSKRTEIINSKTQTILSNNDNNNHNNHNNDFISNKKKTEKIKLHLSRESLIDKDLKRVLLNNEEDLIDLDLDTELDLTISYCLPQTKTLPIISSIITTELTRSNTVNNNTTQHHGSNSTLNDSQFSFNEVSTISSIASSPQPTTITTCSPVNTVNENENDADIDDSSLIINDWQRNSKVNKSNNVNTGKISLNQLKTSNSKLKSKIYYDSLHSNFEYNDDIKITSGQITKYFSDKVKNDTDYTERSVTALSNYDNIATDYQSNEFLSQIKITKLTSPPPIITIPKSETRDSAIYSTGKLSLSDNNGLKSVSVTPSSLIFPNSVTPSGSTTSSNSSSSSYVDSTNGTITNTQSNKNSNINNSNNITTTNNNIYGCSCLVCNCKYNSFLTDVSNNLTFNSLSIKQIILLKKYSLNKLNELLHRYISPIDLSKIKLSSNYDKTSKFYSFRSFNTHNSTSSVAKEKRILNGNINSQNPTTNSYTIHNNNTKQISNYRVFGLNLSTHYQRTGSPLPDIILNSINIIEANSKELIGIFRKPGVKTRIDEVHKLIDIYPKFKFLHNQGDSNKENDSSAQISYSIGDEYQNNNNNKIDFFDMADLVKQFFRELPECILTNNLSQVILSIYLSTGKNYFEKINLNINFSIFMI
jgi:hypothetical protein